jgi:2'-5' RNA ligase
MKDYGYIEITFPPREITKFVDLTKKICLDRDYYYSPVIDYIQGNVSKKLHLTLFYGIISSEIDEASLIKYVRGIKLKRLKLGKLFLLPGYKNLYQVLCVEVLDSQKTLERISQSFKKFKYEESVQHNRFEPHLTLAYLEPKYKLRHQRLKDLPKEIKVKEIKYHPS